MNAYKKIEHASKERDRNPTENREKNNRGVEFRDRIDLEKLLCSHFRILVVSKLFDRMSNAQRVALVYEELLEVMGTNILPPQTGIYI